MTFNLTCAREHSWWQLFDGVARAHPDSKDAGIVNSEEEEFGPSRWLAVGAVGVRRRAVCATNLINSRVNNTALIMHSSSAPRDEPTIEIRRKKRRMNYERALEKPLDASCEFRSGRK